MPLSAQLLVPYGAPREGVLERALEDQIPDAGSKLRRKPVQRPGLAKQEKRETRAEEVDEIDVAAPALELVTGRALVDRALEDLLDSVEKIARDRARAGSASSFLQAR